MEKEFKKWKFTFEELSKNSLEIHTSSNGRKIFHRKIRTKTYRIICSRRLFYSRIYYTIILILKRRKIKFWKTGARMYNKLARFAQLNNLFILYHRPTSFPTSKMLLNNLHYFQNILPSSFPRFSHFWPSGAGKLSSILDSTSTIFR